MRYDPDTFERSQLIDETAVTLLAASTLSPSPVGERPGAVAAAPDVPAAVGGLIAAAYAALIVALFIATAGSLSSIFAIVIAGLFVAIFFTVPRIFFAVEPMLERRPGLSLFLKSGMQTMNGHSSGPSALIQMLVVPVFLTFGVLAMGLIAALT